MSVIEVVDLTDDCDVTFVLADDVGGEFILDLTKIDDVEPEPLWQDPRVEMTPEQRAEVEAHYVPGAILDTVRYHQRRQGEMLMKQSGFMYEASNTRSKRLRKKYTRKAAKYGLRAEYHQLEAEETQSRNYHGIRVIQKALELVEEKRVAEAKQRMKEIESFNLTPEEMLWSAQYCV